MSLQSTCAEHMTHQQTVKTTGSDSIRVAGRIMTHQYFKSYYASQEVKKVQKHIEKMKKKESICTPISIPFHV